MDNFELAEIEVKRACEILEIEEPEVIFLEYKERMILILDLYFLKRNTR